MGEELKTHLSRTGAQVTSLLESSESPGTVELLRDPPGVGGPRKKEARERIVREIDLSDPRVLEPWLDSSLLGRPPHGGAVLLVGRSGTETSLLRFGLEGQELV